MEFNIAWYQYILIRMKGTVQQMFCNLFYVIWYNGKDRDLYKPHMKSSFPVFTGKKKVYNSTK